MAETQVREGFVQGNGRDIVTGEPYQEGINVEIVTTTKEDKSLVTGKVEPEKLYRLSDKESFDVPMILKVRKVINELINHIDNARENADDEVERENIMTYFTEDTFKLNMFLEINDNFRDAICLLETAVIAQNTSVYDKSKIYSLREVLNLMRSNIYMDEKILDTCYDKLEEAGFDLNAPMRDADFGE